MIRNLVLCYSPFQSFVWINLQRQYAIQDTTILYFTSVDSEKDRFYYNNVRHACEAGAYFVLSGNVLCHISSIRAALRKLKFFDVQINLYLASFNAFHSLYILSALNTASINLYDDGAFSLLSTGEQFSYRWNTSKLQLSKGIFYSLLLKYRSDQIFLDYASLFYSIFPKHLVSFPGLTVLPVNIALSPSKSAIDRPRQADPIKVFIGDATHLYSDDLFIVYQMALNKLKCDYYLQHPRDLRTQSVYSPAAFSTPLIAEDFISNLLSLGEDVYVYSFGSTALFSFSCTKIVKTMIYHPCISSMSLVRIADQFSVNIIDIDTLIAGI